MGARSPSTRQARHLPGQQHRGDGGDGMTQFGRACMSSTSTSLRQHAGCQGTHRALVRHAAGPLVKEMRLAGISTIEAPTPSCRGSWRITPALRQGPHQPLGCAPSGAAGMVLEDIFAWKEERTSPQSDAPVRQGAVPAEPTELTRPWPASGTVIDYRRPAGDPPHGVDLPPHLRQLRRVPARCREQAPE